MKNGLVLVFAIFSLVSCKTAKLKPQLTEDHSMVGVYIKDTKTGKVICAHNEGKNFVPASNTKIITLYTGLKALGDSIPAFKYFRRNDSLFVLGTGDPTLLHPDFAESKALELLKTAKTVIISDQNFAQNSYGVGWAWDDYADYYQAEISPLPVYGNVLRASLKEGFLNVSPGYFANAIKDGSSPNGNLQRNQWDNTFFANKKANRGARFSQEIPFKTSIQLTASLLSGAIGRSVDYKDFEITEPLKTAFSHPVDTVFRKMMQQSDNLLAEQLLLLAGGQYSDTISSSRSIENLSKWFLQDAEVEYKWRDGSGLSRYNLFSPKMMVGVLDKLYKEFPEERVFSLMSIGGKAGTLRNKYKAETPYVFAKTGSMGGVYNESGYIITKKGRVLTYSVMRNNFAGTVASNGQKTMELMQWVRENY